MANIPIEDLKSKFQSGDYPTQADYEDLIDTLANDESGGNLGDYVPLTQKGIADGVATLDLDGQVPSSQLGNVDVSGAISTHNSDTTNIHGIVDTSALATKTYADNAAATAAAALVASAPSALDTLNELAASLGNDGNFATTVTTALAAKAPLASPTFTGTVVLPSTVNGPSISTSVNLLFPTQGGHITLGGSQTTGNLTLGGGANRTTGAINIGTGATTIGTKTINVGTGSTGGTTAVTIGSSSGATSNITLNGNVTLPSTTSIGNVSATELGYLDGVTSAIQTQLDGKASTSSPTISNPQLNVSSTQTSVSMFTVYISWHPDIGVLYIIDQNYDMNVLDNGNTFYFSGTGTTLDSIPFIVTSKTDQGNSLNLTIQAVNSSDNPTVENFVEEYSAVQVSGDLNKTTISTKTVSATEVGYLDGVTSAIQTQLDAKQAVVSGVSDTEIGYLANVTSDIQAQIDAGLSANAPTITDPTLSLTQTNTYSINIGSAGLTQTASSPRVVMSLDLFWVLSSTYTPAQGDIVTLSNLSGSVPVGFDLEVLSYTSGESASVSLRAVSSANDSSFADYANMNGQLESGTLSHTATSMATVLPTELLNLDGLTENVQNALNTRTLSSVAVVGYSGHTLNAEVGTKYFIAYGYTTVVLPNNPPLGAEIQIFDVSGSASLHPILIDRNGQYVNGAPNDWSIDADFAVANLVWLGDGFGWRLG